MDVKCRNSLSSLKLNNCLSKICFFALLCLFLWPYSNPNHICLGQFCDILTTQPLHIVLSYKRFTFWHLQTFSEAWAELKSGPALPLTAVISQMLQWRAAGMCILPTASVTSGKWMHVAVSSVRKHRNPISSLSGVALTTQAMLFNKRQNLKATVVCNFLCGDSSIL